MYKLCVFDFDGTLANSLTTIMHYGNEALKKNNLQEATYEEYRMMVGNGIHNLVKRMCKKSNVEDEETIQKVFHDYNTAYNANPSYLTEPYEGIIDLVKKLKGMGVKIAVLSNKPHFPTTELSKLIFGESMFDRVYGQREGVPIKPDPQSLLSIIQELGCTKENTCYFGDSMVDMDTGKNAGVYTVGVLWGFRDRKELEEHKADLIVSKPSEILEFIKKSKK